jgi:accessory secretory protein Asp2
MKKKRTRYAIQFGGEPLDLTSRLAPDLTFAYVTEASTVVAPEQPLFTADQLTPVYRDALFFLTPGCPWLDQPLILGQLPANQILYPQGLELEASAQAMLTLRGAQALDFSDLDALAHTIRLFFFGGQDGYSLPFSSLRPAPGFTGSMSCYGEVYTEFSGDFGSDWTMLAYPNESVWVPVGMQNSLTIESECVAGSAELQLVVDIFHPRTRQRTQHLVLTGEQLRSGRFEAPGGESSCFAQVVIFARGQGTVRIGDIHLRRSRGPYGELFVNGQRLVEPAGQNGEVITYFDAGDMQPPLSVYFSGYQTKESFEGNFMMRGMHGPYLLITDPRLEGGAFYTGSAALRQQVVTTIQQTLTRLDFGRHDVILSGLSMGTYAALYYAADLAPYAVVVGKPLVNIGTIAANDRLVRPNAFPTSKDVLLQNQGALDGEAVAAMNEVFWAHFATGDFANTTFAVAYMENDDYDQTAFPQLRDYLKAHYPLIRIFSKGLLGRHNDDTPGITGWFVKQYRHLITQRRQEVGA